MDFKKIKYINLHAHSDYSLQDGVGEPSEHYFETIRKGHTGCCITDHASYAAPFELYNLKLSEKKNKETQEVFRECGVSEHAIVPGVELYVYDDTLREEFRLTIEYWNEGNHYESLLKSLGLIKKAKNDNRYSSLFDIESVKESRDLMSDVKKKEVNKAGQKLIDKLEAMFETQEFNLESKELKKLKSDLMEFGQATTRCRSYKYNHITLLAKNETGHRNLCRLVSESHLPENVYVRPRIALSELLKKKEGLIATTGCFIGMIPQAIYRETNQERALIELFLKEFGDDFYIEIHLGDLSWEWRSSQKAHVKTDSNPQVTVNLRLLELVKEFGLENHTYITQDSHMPKKEDKEHQDLMILSDNTNSNGWHFKDAYYIMTVEEMWEKCKEYHGYITLEQFVKFCENTQVVQEKCKDFSINKSPKLVNFKPENHHSSNPKRIKKDIHIEGEKKRKYGRSIESLVKESNKNTIKNDDLDTAETERAAREIELANAKISALKTNYPNEYYLQKVLIEAETDEKLAAMIRTCIIKCKIDLDIKSYRDRFFLEVNTVQLNGYQPLVDYFMMVEELPYITRELGELSGLGRGSAAGSLMCYALDITNVDSLKMDLSFTRFLPKERIGTLNFNFSELPFSDYLLQKFPNGDCDFTVELFGQREKLLSLATSLGVSKSAERELRYLYHNPEICDYLLLLKEKFGREIENDCNSHVAHLLGIAREPSGSINEDKGSMPDIDFDSSCREDICEFMMQKHGKNKAILIGTYGSLQIKSALKEILRIKPAVNEFGQKEILRPSEMNKVTQLFERVKFSEEEKAHGSLWMLDECLERSVDIKKFFEQNSDIYEYTKKVLGTKKSWGIHAAGIIMSEEDITSWIPCFYSSEKNAYVSQLDMGLVENFGFVKMDALGLITLEIIRDAFYLIKRNHGVDYFNRLEEIAFNEDSKVLSNFAPKADTLGIFQFGPPVPTAYLRRVKNPINFAFLPMTTSELRPGPMSAGVPEEVLKVINGVSPATYLHPTLEGVLSKTYGYVVYQEQVIKICILFGLTPFEADSVRRAMGKKKFDLIQSYKVKFLAGALKRGVTKASAEEIWKVMEKFAEYGFNESHAVAYAGLSVIQMFIKTYYLNEFIAASLSSFSKKDTPGNKENYKKFQRVYKDTIVTPDVSSSQMDYTIRDGKVIMPIFSISRIGEEASKNIIALAPFDDFEDMVFKFKAYQAESKTIVENLILSGSCDSFRPSLNSIRKLLTDGDVSEHIKREKLNQLIEILEYRKDETLSDLLSSIKYNLNEIGIFPSDSEYSELFSSAGFKRGISSFEFRKFLMSKYYRDLYHRKIHKKIEDAMLLDFNEDDDLKSQLRLKILKLENNSSDSLEILNGVDLVRQFTRKAIGSVKNVVSRGTESNLSKVAESLDSIEKWTIQEMIIKELELLKTTTYDFSSLVDNQSVVSDCMPISKLKTSLDGIRSKLEICVGVLDQSKVLLVEKKITPEGSVELITGVLNTLSTVLPHYSIRKILSKTLRSVLSDSRISETDKGAMACYIGLLLNEKAAKFIPKDLRRKIPLRSALSKRHLSAIKNVTKSSDENFVRESELNMSLDLTLDEEFRFHLFAFVILNGKQGIKKFQERYPNCQEVESVSKSIVDLKISSLNIQEWRGVIGLFDFKNPLDLILDDAKDSQLVSDKIETSSLLERVKVFDFSYEDIQVMNNKLTVFGAIFRPEKKKDFKRDYLSNGKIKNRLSFSLSENGDDTIDLTVFDSDSYGVIYVGNEPVKYEDVLRDYSLVKVRVRAQFNDDLSDYKFTVDTGANTLMPIKFNS